MKTTKMLAVDLAAQRVREALNNYREAQEKMRNEEHECDWSGGDFSFSVSMICKWCGAHAISVGKSSYDIEREKQLQRELHDFKDLKI